MKKLAKIKAMLMCFIILVLALPLTVFASAGVNYEAEAHILNVLRQARIPNAAVAVIQDGETSYILKDSEYDTLFQIASLSKSFTGFGVLLLEDMGLLSVSDPVNWHLPWFEVRYNGVLVPHEDITIYNLLHNTSGITSNERLFPRATLTETTDEFIARLIGLDLVFYPSMRYTYGNKNFVILGLLIEAVSGQSYDEFITGQVLVPLGLYNTFTNVQRAHDTGRTVNGHVRGFLQIRPGIRGLDSHITSIPTGGLYSSVVDMARWAGIQLGIVEVPEQFAKIVQRSHKHHGSDAPFESKSFFYAAGWVVDFENGHIEHSGQSTPGYSATIRMFPESTTAVVVLSNLRYISIEQLGEVVLAAAEGSFNRRRIDFHEIVDTAFVIYTVVGIVYAFMLIRLAAKLSKRLRSGERVKFNLTSVTVKGLIDPISSVVGIIAFYVVFPAVANTTIEMIMRNWPLSFITAVIALWVGVLYSLFSWWVKVFVSHE